MLNVRGLHAQPGAAYSHVAKPAEIHTFLNSYGIFIDRKTLYTDMQSISGTMKREVKYDYSLRGWWMDNPPFTSGELRLMVDGVQASNFITQKEADEITRKIKGLTDRFTATTLDRPAMVANRIHSKDDSVVKGADKLYQAIAANSKVSFQYFHYRPGRDARQYSKDGDRYIVSPYALYWSDGNYYLYAYDGKKFRYFRVDRMERISNPLADKREGKELYDKKALTVQKVKVFGMYSGDRYDVRIRFRNELADAVIDRFGKDTVMIPADDEHFTVLVPVEVSPPFFAWIATFGRRVKILGPQPVIDKMKKFIEAVSDMYKDEGKM